MVSMITFCLPSLSMYQQGQEGIAGLVSGKGGRPTDRIKRSSPVGSVILPMPKKHCRFKQTVSFSGDKMNALQAAGASVIGGILRDDPLAMPLII